MGHTSSTRIEHTNLIEEDFVMKHRQSLIVPGNMARIIVGVVSMLALLGGCGGGGSDSASQDLPTNYVLADNPSGTAVSVFTSGMPDPNHPFFKPRGNGRSCDTCHQAAAGWTLVPDQIQA